MFEHNLPIFRLLQPGFQFFSIMCLFKTWTVMTLHNFLYSTALNKLTLCNSPFSLCSLFAQTRSLSSLLVVFLAFITFQVSHDCHVSFLNYVSQTFSCLVLIVIISFLVFPILFKTFTLPKYFINISSIRR